MTVTASHRSVRGSARGFRMKSGVGACAVLAVLSTPMGDARAGQQKVGDDAARLLRGTIDIHVHTMPDSANRALDGIEASKMALAKGMRGLVLKNHLDPTAGLAFLARKEAPGVEVFGGVDLNLPVGGMNPFAVEHMTQVSGGFGRMVWMSTSDAENVVLGLEKSKRPFVSVARDGVLLPETKAVIEVIAKHGLVLATGHTGAEEALLLLREGKARGVAHMVVTHPLSTSPNMNIAQMQESAKLGAFIEIAGVQVVEATAADPAGMMNRILEVIHKVGPEYIVLSSDLGQKGNLMPVDGYGTFLAGLLAKGITEQEIGLMSRRNPARLLGLPPGAP